MAKRKHHSKGTYFLRYAKNGKRVWEAVGTDAQDALAAQQKKQKSSQAKAAGVELAEDVLAKKQTNLTDAITEYLAEVKDSKAIKTYLAYSLTLDSSAKRCHRRA
jgi:hypothetical protein